MKKNVLSMVLAVVMALCICAGCVSVFAAEKTVKAVTIETNTDINPFIRLALHQKTFKSGGPFTFRGEINISKYQRKKGDANVFINIVDGRDKDNMTVWRNTWHGKTNGWEEIKDYEGNFITFNNIDKVLISGAFEKFGLMQFGCYYADAVVSFRNIRILNAAGKVVYSWDTDPNMQNLTNLKNAEGNTNFALTFGDGSAFFKVSDMKIDGGSEPAPSVSEPVSDDGPVYEDEESEEKPSSPAPAPAPEQTTSDTPAYEDDVPEAPSAEELPEPSSAGPEPNEQTETEITVSTEPAEKEEQEKAPATNVWLWVAIGGGVLLLLAVGVIVFLLVKAKKNNVEDQ